jgi:hypothetical protein
LLAGCHFRTNYGVVDMVDRLCILDNTIFGIYQFRKSERLVFCHKPPVDEIISKMLPYETLVCDTAYVD